MLFFSLLLDEYCLYSFEERHRHIYNYAKNHLLFHGLESMLAMMLGIVLVRVQIPTLILSSVSGIDLQRRKRYWIS